jgi:DNA-binding GntR family transcriptional regulator
VRRLKERGFAPTNCTAATLGSSREETDRKFHVGPIATLANKPLADLVETPSDRVRLRRFKNGSTREYIAQSASEHFQLLDALSKLDEAGAVAVIGRHLGRSRHVWGEGAHTDHT